MKNYIRGGEKNSRNGSTVKRHLSKPFRELAAAQVKRSFSSRVFRLSALKTDFFIVFLMVDYVLETTLPPKVFSLHLKIFRRHIPETCDFSKLFLYFPKILFYPSHSPFVIPSTKII